MSASEKVHLLRACAGIGSSPALDPMLMMAVPPPFATCHQSTPLACGVPLEKVSLHALICKQCTYTGVCTRQ